MLAHIHVTPPLAIDLDAVGLGAVEHEWATGIWTSPCPACVSAGRPPETTLRHAQIDFGEPFEVTCSEGCNYVAIVTALAQLVRERLATSEPAAVGRAA